MCNNFATRKLLKNICRFTLDIDRYIWVIHVNYFETVLLSFYIYHLQKAILCTTCLMHYELESNKNGTGAAFIKNVLLLEDTLCVSYVEHFFYLNTIYIFWNIGHLNLFAIHLCFLFYVLLLPRKRKLNTNLHPTK